LPSVRGCGFIILIVGEGARGRRRYRRRIETRKDRPMIHAKRLTVIGTFAIFAATMPSAAAVPVGAGKAALQGVAPSEVVLAQDRSQRPRRARVQRNIGQANALGPAFPSGSIDFYQPADPCRYVYPCNMSNTLD
jgi:hypothetical protein